ncbi:MAG TPA: glycosyl hydrolase 108 family protein [Chthoniobacteraceae bacterium]|jgi:lysozyme family protein|nr:glycosyl hydrolase 108 family protein [Chthoniobacteraceae bacterium]
MTDHFTASLGFVLRHECAYAEGHDGDLAFVVTEDVPGDSGGLTKWGIDAADHPGVDIAGLTLDQASEIYRAGEWTECKCDLLPAGVDTAIFDAAVNQGVKRSVKMLQQALFQRGLPIATDGELGPITLALALKEASIDRRGLLTEMLAQRRQWYGRIVSGNPPDAKFLNGWLNRVNDLQAFLQQGGMLA